MQRFTLYRADSSGNPKNTVYPISADINGIDDFRTVVQYDHVCAKYKGNRRSEANFEYSDCIAMDCDNDHSEDPAAWKSPADVEAEFPDAEFYVAYSRNHMKEKNGRAARPKFHVYFPVKRVTDAKRYAAMKQQILKRFPWFDANAADAARFYFGSDNGADFFPGTVTVDKLLHEIIPTGSRNATLSQKAGCIVKRYRATDEAHALFMAEAEKCVPPLEQTELDAIWNSAKKFGDRISSEEGYIPPEKYNAKGELDAFLDAAKPENGREYAWSDIGAGRLFADCFKEQARYVPERKCWYIYKNGVWSADTGNLGVMELCKKLADALLVYALRIDDERARTDFLKYASKWQSRYTRETLLKDAQSCYPIPMSEFDRDPYILNCANGTLHLDTMEFTEHRPEDRLTKSTGVFYDPDVRCKRFEEFINEIMSGDREKARFLQKALGYGISGDTRYECLFILHGATSRNGKGTLCESIVRVVGSYGCTVQPETISDSKYTNSHNPSEDIARLAGIRFANIAEPKKGMVLNAAKVKSMTGNDTINARFLHENSFDFRPQFKIVINTNHLPVINDMTLFQSGRIIIIPFNRHFEDDEQDKTLKDEFFKQENQTAILNWLVEGYRMLRQEGLVQPEAVKAATAEYSHDSDKIRQFVEERLEEKEGHELRTSDVHGAYKDWCMQNNFGAENIKNFNQALRSFAQVVRKRPKAGGGATTMLLGYRIIGRAEPLQ